MMGQVPGFVPELYPEMCQFRVFGEFFMGVRLIRLGTRVAKVWGNELLPQIMGGGFTSKLPPTTPKPFPSGKGFFLCACTG